MLSPKNASVSRTNTMSSMRRSQRWPSRSSQLHQATAATTATVKSIAADETAANQTNRPNTATMPTAAMRIWKGESDDVNRRSMRSA